MMHEPHRSKFEDCSIVSCYSVKPVLRCNEGKKKDEEKTEGCYILGFGGGGGRSRHPFGGRWAAEHLVLLYFSDVFRFLLQNPGNHCLYAQRSTSSKIGSGTRRNRA